ncbi:MULTISPECIES: hypothetical protein [Actinomadura]|uniref:Uncharacterized protein n=1 Tax=Actinomadura yumaensis TaxID=111807 RepID=A0ABW2CJ18_9ACTN|nr:hypothetical protein [Actinomadura sp. J1-007]MWK40096.1 hypothetical protein [Actinomadura sp. J1-007]
MQGIQKRLAGLSVVGLALGLVAGSAGTATAAGAGVAQTGSVFFYENSDFTGRTISIRYTGCSMVVRDPFPTHTIGSFDNRPPAGCQVALLDRVAGSTVLCAGRGQVPAPFRRPSTVLIKPGVSRPCGIGA